MPGAGISVKIEGMDTAFDASLIAFFSILIILSGKLSNMRMQSSKHIRSRTPKRFRKLVRFKLYEDRTRANYVLIGF